MSNQDMCRRCRAQVATDARFCSRCGIDAPTRVAYLSQREGLIALIGTLVWVMVTVFLAEREAGLFILVSAFEVVLPAMILIAVMLFRMHPTRSSTWLRNQPLNPAVVVLMTLAWLSVSLVLVSDPEDENVGTGVLGFVYALGLGLSWFGLLGVATQIAIATRWRLSKRLLWVVGYLLPLPMAAWFFFYPVGEDFLAVKARFELSESALDRAVIDRPPASHRAGLFQVSKIEDVEKCVFLETGGVVLADGFAYCPEGRPSRAMSDSPLDILMYPLDGDWENAKWWEYEIVTSYSDGGGGAD